MSLINEALRRAQEVQTRELPRGPMLRPAEPEQHRATKRFGLLLPGIIALVGLIGLLAIWKFGFGAASPEPERSNQVRALEKSPSPEPRPVVAAILKAEPASAPAPAPVPVQPAPKPVTQAETVPAAPVPAPVEQPQLPLVVQPQVIPALKLQSVVFSKPPSAMISGMIVRQGDMVGDFKVRSILANKVELVSPKETIVLTLR